MRYESILKKHEDWLSILREEEAALTHYIETNDDFDSRVAIISDRIRTRAQIRLLEEFIEDLNELSADVAAGDGR
jgi:hypothetical protein